MSDKPFAIGSKIWPGLSKLIEEAGEVQQVAGKLIATGGKREHWDGSDLKVRLEEELGDLMAAIDFVVDNCDLDDRAVLARADRKLEVFRRWHLLDPPSLHPADCLCDAHSVEELMKRTANAAVVFPPKK